MCKNQLPGKKGLQSFLVFSWLALLACKSVQKLELGVTTKDDAISRLLLTMLITDMGYGYPVLKIASSPDMDFTTKYRAEISPP